jgi:hypothetical protein
MELDKLLFKGSHDTTVIGWDKAGMVVFLKSYKYDEQKDEAQKDRKALIDAGLAWKIGHVTNLKFDEGD